MGWLLNRLLRPSTKSIQANDELTTQMASNVEYVSMLLCPFEKDIKHEFVMNNN